MLQSATSTTRLGSINSFKVLVFSAPILSTSSSNSLYVAQRTAPAARPLAANVGDTSREVPPLSDSAHGLLVRRGPGVLQHHFTLLVHAGRCTKFIQKLHRPQRLRNNKQAACQVAGCGSLTRAHESSSFRGDCRSAPAVLGMSWAHECAQITHR